MVFSVILHVTVYFIYYVPDIKSVKNISDLRKDLDYFTWIFRINVQHALLRRVGQLEGLGRTKVHPGYS